jgi:hypothetical protein
MGTDNPNGEQLAAIERVLAGLLGYNPRVAKSSIAIIYYNLALINRAKKDKVAAQKFLQLAKDISPTEVDRRLRVDTRFYGASAEHRLPILSLGFFDTQSRALHFWRSLTSSCRNTIFEL